MNAADSSSKVTHPRLQETVPRTRLFEELDAARNNPLIWIVGPAGAGKTTLVSSYIDNRDFPSLWYQVDEGDADVASFFYYLGLAARNQAPDNKPLPLLTPEYALGLPVFTRRFFEQLSDMLDEPFILVLDNYQLVPDESPLHEIVATAAESVAGKGHIVAVSRVTPPAVFARLQANRLMDIIGWESLKLRDDEIGDLYCLLCGEQKPSKQLRDQLRAQSGGWLAGLILLLGSRVGQKGEALAPMPDGETPQALFDYFANEIFKHQDAPIRQFLLRTAVLSRITSWTAQALSGDQDANRILGYLNSHHYFTERHSQTNPFYQYHSLFREFLLATARQQFGDEAFQDLQREAASLLEQEGQVEAAIDLYLSAQDWTQLARVVCENAQRLIMQGRGGTVEQWLKRIPETLMKEMPWLQFWLGVASMGPAPMECRQYLEQAYFQFREQGDIAGMCMALASIVDTFSFGWFDFFPLDGWIDELEALVAEHPQLPSPEIEARLAVSMFVALMHRRPDHPDIERWAQRAREVARIVPSANERVIIGMHLATYYVWWGRHHDMELLMEELRPVIGRDDVSAIGFVAFHTIEAMYYTRSFAGDGVSTARAGLERAEQSGVYVLNPLLLGFSALAALNIGRLDAAGAYLETLAAQFHPARLMDQGFYYWNRGHLAWLQGDVATACECARQCSEIVKKSGSGFHECLVPLTLAKILFEAGEVGEAEVMLENTLAAVRKTRNPALEYECLLIRAKNALACGDDAAGLEDLRDALAIMRRTDAASTIWWNPSWNVPLLTRALEAGIEVEFVRTLIRKHKLEPDAEHTGIEAWPWPVRIKALGGFELECNGEPLVSRGKAQKKTLELLKAIVGFGGHNVGSTQLADALWPDADADAALQSLKTTLHRLRKLLGCDGAIEVSEGNVSLSARHCWTDVWAFERRLVTGDTEEAIAMYHGPFLGNDDMVGWAMPCRERLHNRFVRSTQELGTHLEQLCEWDKSLLIYEQGVQVDELVEPFYQGMMRCYEALGRHADGIATFERCSRTIESRFGVPLSWATTQIAERLQNP